VWYTQELEPSLVTSYNDEIGAGEKGGSMMPRELLTARGHSSRERILTQAAQLVYEKGVQGTSLDDICAAASVSKSQLYHYFTNKEDLVLAIIERQTSMVLAGQQPFLDHLDSWENLERWGTFLVASLEKRQCVGGCPVGSLASELADHNEASRVALVSSFDQWERYLIEGLTSMQEHGELRRDADQTELAVAVMASLQGGLLLSQTRKTTRPLQIALHAAFTYIRSFVLQNMVLSSHESKT
jgi:TetR/AcrR family transcriptional regulator, transcriptional repressor for nem operon